MRYLRPVDASALAIIAEYSRMISSAEFEDIISHLTVDARRVALAMRRPKTMTPPPTEEERRTAAAILRWAGRNKEAKQIVSLHRA